MISERRILATTLLGSLLALLALTARAADPPEAPIEDYDREHWSFRPVARPAVPQVKSADWCRTPVDRFILRKLEKKNLTPMPEADPLTLLRRITFDLTGLPPSQGEIAQFLHDNEQGPDAYDRLVDRLLASPAYGERAAQFWLDLARFAETDGFEHDKVRPEAWRYRDWVIRALSADIPYGRFVSEQLAGDEIAPGDPDAAIATGFLLAGPDMPDINLQEERRHEFFNGMTANVGEVLLGLQFGCCQCHDHKTDPLSQYDFYRFRAFFDSMDVLGAMEKEEQADAPRETVRAGLRVARNARKPLPSHLALRGDFRRVGPVVEPAVPRVADWPSGSNQPPPAWRTSSGGRRTALAEWIADPQNPLTARVIVNRLWQQHFGAGLVSTPSDFGLMGAPPTHPELLDWLASEFLIQGGSLKSFHRLLITSATYRTASRPSPASPAATDERWHSLATSDPANELLGRFRRRRLDGESLRDTLLFVSGQLNPTQAGPGVRPPLPPEVVGTLLRDQWAVTKNSGDHTRRSIYLFARRNLRFPLLEVFDKPDTNISCPRRMTTTIAPQALHLMNSEFVHTCAARLADSTAQAPSGKQRLDAIYARLFARTPTAIERQSAETFLGAGDPDAWRDLCLALLGTSESLYVD